MEDPGEGSSSSAYPDVTTPEPKPTILVSQDETMPESAKVDDDSESDEDDLPWEDVNLMAIVRGEVDRDKLVPPKFGKDLSYPFVSPVRTNVPFPEGWTEAQKAAAISPNSPYYTMSQPTREFPPGWTRAQIAAANSPSSTFYIAPGQPISSTTPRLPAVPLTGLFRQIEASPQPFQGSSTFPAESTPSFVWKPGNRRCWLVYWLATTIWL